MSTTTERIGVYGFVNGLGVRGNPGERDRLLRSLHRAIERGDWGRVLELGAAYGVGAYVGSSIRQAAIQQASRVA